MKRLRLLTIFLIALASACTSQQPAVDSVPAAASQPVDKTDRYSDSQLSGWLTVGDVQQYYRGDGLGENLYLTLLSGGHYTLTWKGCLGWYGAAAGTWRVSEKQLELKPDEEHGMLSEHPIRLLHIRVIDNEIVLIQDQEMDWFKTHGVDRYGCFRAQR